MNLNHHAVLEGDAFGKFVVDHGCEHVHGAQQPDTIAQQHFGLLSVRGDDRNGGLFAGREVRAVVAKRSQENRNQGQHATLAAASADDQRCLPECSRRRCRARADRANCRLPTGPLRWSPARPPSL
jgi:hypothetical protein